MLYILMADYLLCKLQQGRIAGNLRGTSKVQSVRGRNHSQFVDDTLLMDSASMIIASRFKRF
jgi:hypothetical protein